MPSSVPRVVDRLVSLVVVVLLDRSFHQPPDGVHPVVGMGRLLGVIGRHVPAGPAGRARRRGGVAWLAGLATVVGTAAGLDKALRALPATVAAVLRGVALWPLVALRMLVDEVTRAGQMIDIDLARARPIVAGLVSRDVTTMDASALSGAAISSCAENLVDSWTAPLSWFAVGGLPAAAAYRYVNTADAMWGYRSPRWRHAGCLAARADDVANLVPARLTGILLAGRAPLRRLRAEARRAPSPNGGWPMAAVALRLGVELSKPGTYRLNAGGRAPQASDIAAASRAVERGARSYAALLMVVVAFVRLATDRRSSCRR